MIPQFELDQVLLDADGDRFWAYNHIQRFGTKLEDLGATNEVTHKEWLP